MPKIDFYVIPENSITAELHFACRLIEKAYKQNRRIYIHTDSDKIAHQLDELLWTYQEESFLPHNLYGEGPDPAPPIQIGINITPKNHRDILINLSEHSPEFYRQFAQIIEIINTDTKRQEAGRERYRAYRTQGFNIETHK